MPFDAVAAKHLAHAARNVARRSRNRQSPKVQQRPLANRNGRANQVHGDREKRPRAAPGAVRYQLEHSIEIARPGAPCRKTLSGCICLWYAASIIRAVYFPKESILADRLNWRCWRPESFRRELRPGSSQPTQSNHAAFAAGRGSCRPQLWLRVVPPTS
jgi:hypothetical protein